MAHAHMAIGVHHILAGQDAIGDHEVAHQGRDVAHEGPCVVNDWLKAGFIYIKARADEIAATRLPCEESTSSKHTPVGEMFAALITAPSPGLLGDECRYIGGLPSPRLALPSPL